MQALELKVPPPIVMVFIAAAMWGVSSFVPVFNLASAFRISAALIFAMTGVGFALAGVITFRRAKTTVNPLKPETASSLVKSGIYRVTRNPMYVGLSLVLIAWTVFLSSKWLLLGPLVFMLYINRFQIQPEERALSSLFGTDYTVYKSRVRRWL
jgi:protein-S-isoprenylcysteine O-methyltransferase Ste14